MRKPINPPMAEAGDPCRQHCRQGSRQRRLLLIASIGCAVFHALAAGIGLAEPIEQHPSNTWLQTWTGIKTLERDASPESARELSRIYTTTNSAWPKGRALVALASLKGTNVIESARHSSQSSNSVLRAAAYEALGIIGGARAVDRLRSGLDDPDESARWQAAIGLARAAGGAAEAELQPLVNETTTNSAAQQVVVLGYLGTSNAFAKLAELAAHADAGIRMRSIMAMHHVQDSRIAPILIARVAEDRGRGHREAADGVLRSLPATLLAEPIAATFRDGKPTHVPVAIRLLFDRPSQAGADALAAVLRDNPGRKNNNLTLLAMDTLLAIDPVRYRDVFTRHMQDKDPMVRIRALLALSAGASETERYALLTEPLIDADDRVFKRALRIVETQTSKAPENGLVPYLTPLLQHADTTRTRKALALLKKRIPVAEIADALEVLGPMLGGTNNVLRAAAADVFTVAVSDEVLRQVAAAQGYLTMWMIVGPFDNDRFNTGYKAVYPPESDINFTEAYTGAKRPTRMADNLPGALEEPSTNSTLKVKWEPWRVTSLEAKLHLNRTMLGAPEYLVSYAAVELASPTDQTVNIEIAGDDSFKAWLNGQLIAAEADEPITKAVTSDREAWRAVVRSWNDNPHSTTAESVKLKQGRNRFLVKVCNFTELWYVRVRITDAHGARANFEEIDVAP